jgi:hypothetical protein
MSAINPLLRGAHLGDTDILHGGLGTVQVDLPCRRQDEQAGLINLGARVGNVSKDGT